MDDPLTPAKQTEAMDEPNNDRNKGEKKMNEVVKFPTNTPVEVTLQYETGKHVEGR